MVSVINKKTNQPHQFSDVDWETAKQKGLDSKFKVVEQTTQLNKEVKNFSPPELEKKIEVTVEKKKAVRKRNTAE